MKKILNTKYQQGIVFAVIVFQIIIIVISMGQKVNFHVDEYYTYTLANSEKGMFAIEPGKIYSGDDVFLEFMAVDSDHRFNYDNVWKNQAEDVHPPFYYIFIHTICSFFPGVFTRWFGLAVNLFFFVVSAFLIFKLSLKIFNNYWKSVAVLSFWGIIVCIVNTAIFIRMYMMFSMFVLGVIYLHMQIYEKKALTKKFFLPLFFLIVGGTLTHYYFLVFLFFTALYYGVYMLIQRRYKDVIKYVFTYVLAGGASILIFPAMLEQIFSGYRGEEAFSALFTDSGYFLQLLEYLKLVTNECS